MVSVGEFIERARRDGRSVLRPLLIGGLMIFIIAEIVFLSPTPLEQNNLPPSTVAPEELLPDTEKATLATGIPKDRIPEYTIDQFHYVATQNGQKQWKLLADRAFLYNTEKLVHSLRVTAYLYNPDGEATIVTGNEAKYFMDKRDLEVFGNVITTFPDGFQTHSEYLRYQPGIKKIGIPTTYLVTGKGSEKDGQEIHFKSMGLDFAMGSSEIVLPQAVQFVMEKRASKQPTPKGSPKPGSGVPDTTTIVSDHCVIFREDHLAKFTMNPEKPLSARFVEVTQPTMFSKGRRADLNYGDSSEMLNYMTEYEDVYIRELDPEKRGVSAMKYATGGRADFDAQKNLIVLKEFPQVYQDNDTVTGDVIIVHRDTDIVEVEHSNAFSEGESNTPSSGHK